MIRYYFLQQTVIMMKKQLLPMLAFVLIKLEFLNNKHMLMYINITINRILRSDLIRTKLRMFRQWVFFFFFFFC